jgi:hypothetical protein
MLLLWALISAHRNKDLSLNPHVDDKMHQPIKILCLKSFVVDDFTFFRLKHPSLSLEAFPRR